jgi:hypothetical protein
MWVSSSLSSGPSSQTPSLQHRWWRTGRSRVWPYMSTSFPVSRTLAFRYPFGNRDLHPHITRRRSSQAAGSEYGIGASGLGYPAEHEMGTMSLGGHLMPNHSHIGQGGAGPPTSRMTGFKSNGGERRSIQNLRTGAVCEICPTGYMRPLSSLQYRHGSGAPTPGPGVDRRQLSRLVAPPSTTQDTW